MKGMHGVRLRPDRAVDRAAGAAVQPQRADRRPSCGGRTSPPAVHDDYQSFFPTDVHVVADHAQARRHARSRRPTGPYYGVDYPARRGSRPAASDLEVPGDRLDWYRNIPVPTSYMCLGTRDDFFGGYDHARRRGLRALGRPPYRRRARSSGRGATRRSAHAWDRNLTDDDGRLRRADGRRLHRQPARLLLPRAGRDEGVLASIWYPIQEIGPAHAGQPRRRRQPGRRAGGRATCGADVATQAHRLRPRCRGRRRPRVVAESRSPTSGRVDRGCDGRRCRPGPAGSAAAVRQHAGCRW